MQGEFDFRQILDASPAVHYVAKATGDFAPIYVSEGVRALLGCAPEELTDRPTFWGERVHPDDQPRVLAELETLFGRERHTLEYRILHANGDWRWVRDELVLVRNDDGRPTRIIGSWLDIAELRATTSALRAIEARLRESQGITGIGSWEIETAGFARWWSDETYRIFGEDPSTPMPSHEAFIAKIHPDDRQSFIDVLGRALADGKPYSIDYRIVLPDGTEKIINGRGRSVASEIGRPARFAGTVQDITERERTEQALREAEARNRALLDANPDVILRVDADGRYLDLSIAATTPFPYAKAELVGRTVEELFGSEFAGEHERRVRTAIETGEIQVWAHHLTLPHGVTVDLESRFVRSGDDEVVITVRDVTKQLALQRDVVAAQERERRLIGHDLHDGLGQELTAISLGLEVLAQELGREGSAQTHAAQNLRGLAQSSISRAHRIAVSLAPQFGSGLGTGKTLAGLASQVDGLANVRCRLECSGEDHEHHIDVDANLYRIAQECLTNALKHAKPKAIELRYACDGKTVRLEVLDDGVGIGPEASQIEGMGMRGMRYRAQLVNGSVEFSRRDTGGTRVAFSCACRRR